MVYKLVARVWAYVMYTKEDREKPGKWEYKQGLIINLGERTNLSGDQLERDLEINTIFHVEDTENVSVNAVKLDYWRLEFLPVDKKEGAES